MTYVIRNGPSTVECREGQHSPVCRGNVWTISSDYPADCACSCHETGAAA